MIRRPPRSTLFPTRRSSDLVRPQRGERRARQGRRHDAGCRRAAGRGGFPAVDRAARRCASRSEEHTSELQSQFHLVCRLLLEKKKNKVDIAFAVLKRHTKYY